MPDVSEHLGIGEVSEATAGRVSRRAFAWGLTAITAVALTIRLLRVALVTGRQRLGHDAFYYYRQAQMIDQGEWFVKPLSYLALGHWLPGADHPPGFVLLLAFLQSIKIRSPMAERYVIAVIGTVTVVVIALTVRYLLGNRAGLIAGFLAAVYPNLWVNDGELMSETLFLLAFSFGLLSVYHYRRTSSWRWFVLLALALTVAASARPEALLLFPLIVLPAVIGATRDKPRMRLRVLLVGCIIPVVAFTPWVVFNSVRFGHPVLMSTGAGQTLLQGNCPATYHGTYTGIDNFGCMNEVPSPSPQVRNKRSWTLAIAGRHSRT